MSDTVIFLVGLLVSILCLLFVIFTVYEVRRVYAETPPSSSGGEHRGDLESES